MWTPSQESASYIQPRNPSNHPSKSSRLLLRRSSFSSAFTSSPSQPVDSPLLAVHPLPTTLVPSSPSSQASTSASAYLEYEPPIVTGVRTRSMRSSAVSSGSQTSSPAPMVSTSQGGPALSRVASASAGAGSSGSGLARRAKLRVVKDGSQLAGGSSRKGKGRATLADDDASLLRQANRKAMVDRIDLELSSRCSVAAGSPEGLLLSKALLHVVIYHFRDSMASPSLCPDQVARNISRHVDVMLGVVSMGPPVRSPRRSAPPEKEVELCNPRAQRRPSQTTKKYLANEDDDDSLVLETPVGSEPDEDRPVEIVEPPSIEDWARGVEREAGDEVVEEEESLLLEAGRAEEQAGTVVAAVEAPSPDAAGAGTSSSSLPIPDSLPRPREDMGAHVSGRVQIGLPMEPVVEVSVPDAPPIVVKPASSPQDAEPLPKMDIAPLIPDAKSDIVPIAIDVGPSSVSLPLDAPVLIPPSVAPLAPSPLPTVPEPFMLSSAAGILTPPPARDKPIPPILNSTSPAQPTSAPIDLSPTPVSAPAPRPLFSLIPSKRPHPSSADLDSDFAPIPIVRPAGWTVPPREREWDPTWGMEMARKKRKWD